MAPFILGNSLSRVTSSLKLEKISQAQPGRSKRNSREHFRSLVGKAARS